ncbi:helix-turn-helix domain-containing protein [Micromonospora citrea]|uniref:helix-turn-helix domain-containing protein n=1 Tax=Micromonospora citrea TaxID=47855 RepID=UPI000B83A9E3|nr:helix-turn-helix domain-containing protein [Micromonospora citrea]
MPPTSPAQPPHTDPELVAVGRRLRVLREERGISLSTLARLAGVGKATLSGLEHGTRNPTLETLYAITAQLGVPLTAVLSGPGTGPTIRGAAVSGILLEVFEDADATYELYRMLVSPGREQLSPAHQRGVTEHVTVFAGVLRAGPVDAPLIAAAGGHLRWTSDVPHVYAAVGDEEVAASLLLRYPRH